MKSNVEWGVAGKPGSSGDGAPGRSRVLAYCLLVRWRDLDMHDLSRCTHEMVFMPSESLGSSVRIQETPRQRVAKHVCAPCFVPALVL